MNKILKLFDEQYVIKLFKKEVLPRYPDFSDIKKIQITPIKKYIWAETYHVVIKFETSFLTKDGKKKKLPLYCSGHSDEPRKNVYNGLKYLWDNGFSKGYLTIPHPLFYSSYFKAVFYRGVKGHNLYYYIGRNNYSEIKAITIKAASWFAKLHTSPTIKAKNFNKENSRIATVIPNHKIVLKSVKRRYEKYYNIYEKAFEILIGREEEFLNSTKKRWLIHGDAHPENIIRMSKNKLAVIDFTDLCLADFARDLGTFFQQFEYMSSRKGIRKDYIVKMKALFLKNYLKESKKNKDSDLRERIDTYYNWTVLRTATFFLLKDNARPDRADELLKILKSNLKL
ncbi:MAG: phosphotransferase [Patescibacteria group bacterium]